MIAFFLAIVALPLLSFPPLFSPPDWGKTVMFRILVSLLLVFLLWRFSGKKISLPVSAPLVLLLALEFVFLLATVFSLEPFFSFWGEARRSWGFLNVTFYMLFAMLAFVFLRQREWNIVWKGIFGVGALISILALFQQFGVQLTDRFLTADARPASTLGSSVALANYLLLLVFCALVFLRSRLKFLLAGLFVFVILLTLTRAAFAGLGIGLAYYMFSFPRLRIPVLGAVLALFALVLFINSSALPLFVKDSVIANNMWHRLSIENAAQDPRPLVWQTALKAIADRPLGYGLYNSSIGLDKHYDARIVGSAPWWDSSHNIFLDIALWTGIPGLAVFVAFLAALFLQLQKAKKRLLEKARVIHGMQAALVAHIVALFFSFYTFPVYLVFFFLTAYSLRLTAGQQAISFAVPRWLPLLLVPVTLWFIAVFNIQPLLLNKQANIAPCSVNIQEQSYIGYYIRAQFIDNCPEHSKQVIEALKANLKLRPYFTRGWLALAQYTGNEEYLKRAESLNPNRWQVYAVWANIYESRGEPEQAHLMRQKSLNLKP